jgi:hypothetical protein
LIRCGIMKGMPEATAMIPLFRVACETHCIGYPRKNNSSAVVCNQTKPRITTTSLDAQTWLRRVAPESTATRVHRICDRVVSAPGREPLTGHICKATG